MSTATGELPALVRSSTSERTARQASESRIGLPQAASVYLFAVAIAAAAAAAPFLLRLNADTPGWATFVVLAGAASLAQLFVVVTSHNQSYYVAGAVLLPAALLLPPEFVALIALVQHVPEWLKQRYAWYIQTFNICNYTLAVLAAWATVQGVLAIPGPDARLGFALAAAAAAVVFVAVNHVLIAPMLKLARGHSIRESGAFSFESLSTDFVLAALGVIATIVWHANPWLIAFAALPLVLIYRALSIPKLQEQARIDPKTGLFNAGHFGEVLVNEIGRSERLERPLSVIMADLDLLRDINNTYGHLAGDTVLAGVAEVFRKELRHYDVPARFGGEEFAILLPETPPEQALEIAERIRRAVAERGFDVDTAGEPVRVTVSLGVAAFPQDGSDPSALVHQADVAVYRAKLQGRNRVVAPNGEVVPQEIVLPPERRSRLASVPADLDMAPATPRAMVAEELSRPRRHLARGPRFLALSWGTTVLVSVVGLAGIAAALAGALLDFPSDVSGLLAIAALVGLGQALAVEYEEGAGSVSVGAVGVLAGAAMFGFGGALVLAAVSVVVDWSARRSPLHRALYNFATVSLASVAAAAVFSFGIDGPRPSIATVLGLVAGAAYFLVNTALVSTAVAVEGHERPWRVWNESFRWLLPHYILYGFVGAVMAVAYAAAGLYALIVFAVPVVLMRRAQVAYLAHTQRNAQRLRTAAETIQAQNVSLEEANQLLKERSTAAMASLSAMVDARDSYTAGHSRRVRRIALVIGAELGLSQPELDILGHAAHFHDVGKIAVPDSVLLKPGALTIEEWKLMKDHAEAGARIIARLGFLADAVPAIRHHHERFDGRGYPDGLAEEEIPLGARIIHVADAMDSMMTTRTYRAALSFAEALAELRASTGTQFCPRSVAGLQRGLTSSSSLFRLERVA